jgi:hypothetical protein
MDDHDEGPLMLAATDVLRPPPARLAKLASIRLPRTVAIRSLVAGGVGLLVALPIGALLGAFLGLQAFIFAAIVGAAGGFFLSTWQPRKGETVFQIAAVRARSRFRQQRAAFDGESVGVSIGIAPLYRLPLGPVRIASGAVPVAPGTVDERGVVRSSKNRNLIPTGVAAFPPATTAPSGGGVLAFPEPEREPAAAIAPAPAAPTSDHTTPGVRVGGGGVLSFPDGAPGAADAPVAQGPAPNTSGGGVLHLPPEDGSEPGGSAAVSHTRSGGVLSFPDDT